tara:strand:+ start:158 stop:655 length:498 start_codon:yes stop_codon:yes gene_type:complete
MEIEKLAEFLKESNYIEKEYSGQAFVDAMVAWDYAFDGREDINLKYVLGIHGFLLENLWPEIAGKVRKGGVKIGGRKYERKPKKVLEGEIKDWIKSCEGMTCEEDVRQAHIRFEHMHPFRDGNGRVGRILMNVQRLNLGLDLLVIHEGWEQSNYYRWFKQSDEKI